MPVIGLLLKLLNLLETTLISVFTSLCFFGHCLVTGILFIVDYIDITVNNARLFTNILVDDCSLFLSDVGINLQFALEIIMEGTSNTLKRLLKAILETEKIISLTYQIIVGNVSNGYFEILNVINIVCNFVYLIYKGFSLIGSTTVTFIIDLPKSFNSLVIFLSEALIYCLKVPIETVKNVTLDVIDFLKKGSDDLVVIIYESTYSFIGFIIGVLLCIAVVLNLKNILLFFLRSALALYRTLCLIINNCWTGEFFNLRINERVSVERQSSVAASEFDSHSLANNAEREENLCIVCLDKPKNVLNLPCRHVCVCNDCSRLLDSNCPVCRMRVRRRLQVFL